LAEKKQPDEYDVDEDADGKDYCEYDAVCRSASFTTLSAQLSGEETVGSCTIRRDRYDVDEDTGIKDDCD
jgi:hypothetical protein